MQMLTIHGAAVEEDTWAGGLFSSPGVPAPANNTGPEPRSVTAQPGGSAPAEKSRPEPGLERGTAWPLWTELGGGACSLCPPPAPPPAAPNGSGLGTPGLGRGLSQALV